MFTVLSGMNAPRYMNVADIVAQSEKTVDILTFDDLTLDKTQIGLSGSPTKVKTTFPRGAASGGEKYELEPAEAAKLIAAKLREKYYI